MSYSYRHSLHGVTGSDVYPSGTLMVGGYQVTGLAASDAANATARLRDAFAASFPMGSITTPATSGADRGRPTSGWGPGYGVPAGTLYGVISTTRDGVTGAEVNAAFAAVARDLQRRLGLTVRNSHAHTLGGAAPLPALTADPGTPVDASGAPIVSSTSPMLIGGIIAITVAVGGLVYALTRRRPVARNRRRHRR